MSDVQPYIDEIRRDTGKHLRYYKYCKYMGLSEKEAYNIHDGNECDCKVELRPGIFNTRIARLANIERASGYDSGAHMLVITVLRKKNYIMVKYYRNPWYSASCINNILNANERDILIEWIYQSSVLYPERIPGYYMMLPKEDGSMLNFGTIDIRRLFSHNKKELRNGINLFNYYADTMLGKRYPPYDIKAMQKCVRVIRKYFYDALAAVQKNRDAFKALVGMLTAKHGNKSKLLWRETIGMVINERNDNCMKALDNCDRYGVLMYSEMTINPKRVLYCSVNVEKVFNSRLRVVSSGVIFYSPFVRLHDIINSSLWEVKEGNLKYPSAIHKARMLLIQLAEYNTVVMRERFMIYCILKKIDCFPVIDLVRSYAI